MTAPLPDSLHRNPVLSRWVNVDPDGTIAVRCGKVEIGQGIVTALAQVIAEELDVDLARIRMLSVTTGTSPDEAFTAGSRSLQDSGSALRQVGAEVRAHFLARAQARLGVPADQLEVRDGWITAPGGAGTTSYWELAEEVDLDVPATGSAPAKPASAHRVLGTSAPRGDIPDKVLGRPRYVHDLRLPGMLYGRVVRPPSPAATLRAVDPGAAKTVPGVVEVVVDGGFLGVIASEEETAIAAAEQLRRGAEWNERESLPDQAALADFLAETPADREVVDQRPLRPGLAAAIPARTLSSTYARPYLAHASIAPSCAVARWDEGSLRVWSHSQGVYPLRAALAQALAVPSERIVVRHVEGAGRYGHNAADDVAYDAARLARAVPGQSVQVVWSRADELTWAPFGPPMSVQLSADLAGDGSVLAWRHRGTGGGHVSRPTSTSGPGLLGAAHTSDPVPISVAVDPPLARGGGGQRNAVPLYQFPEHEIGYHRLLDMPLRTSAMRALGGFMNVFAIESFMDELATAAGTDPVEYRLRHLRDQRARAVVEAAAARAGWPGRDRSDESRGTGFGFARYGNKAAYCAVVAEVHAENEVRVEKLTIAVEAGLIVNPDGLRNQIEGGAIQSTSWTVKEQVRFDRTRVTSGDWESYPILRFSEVPPVDVILLDRPDLPSLGAGEASMGPTAAAIANAVCAGTSIRVRTLPLTPEQVIAALQD